MMKTGLVSISFRKLKVHEIASLAAKCCLAAVEWGGDVHVPLGDTKAAREALRITREEGLMVATYGSYVRMKKEDRASFTALVDTARALEAPAIRVWAGTDVNDSVEEIAESTQLLCDMAPEMIITFESHFRTITETAEGGKALLTMIDRPNARSQWQPGYNLEGSMPMDQCLAFIETMRPWLYNVHVYSWEGTVRLPLEAHADRWKHYLRALAGERCALLEFVQDDDPVNLVRDAKVLHRWIEELKI